jgi:phosphoribosylanthranilate isomerase
MAKIGFKLTDIKEQEYTRGSCKVGIASDGDLLRFAGIDPRKLTVLDTPCSYRVLTLQDYLSVYQASSRDGYRKDVREKDDKRKLLLIKKELRIT